MKNHSQRDKTRSAKPKISISTLIGLLLLVLACLLFLWGMQFFGTVL